MASYTFANCSIFQDAAFIPAEAEFCGILLMLATVGHLQPDKQSVVLQRINQCNNERRGTKRLTLLLPAMRPFDKGRCNWAPVDLGLAAVHLDKGIPLSLGLVTFICPARVMLIALFGT